MLFRVNTKSNHVIFNNDRKNKKIDRNDTKNNKRSLRKPFFLFPPISRIILLEKVSSCTLQKCKRLRKRKPAGHRKHFLYRASLAVETALVLPLFFLGVITMIGYMDIYKIQTEHLTNLCQNAKEAAMYAYSTAGSSADELIFPDSYSYKPISALVRMPAIWFQNQVKVRCWTGVSSTYFAARDSMVKMVFMAENGEVFHKNPSCSYLNVSVLQVSGKQIKSVKNQNGENYYACEICSRHQKPAGTVYVTGQGTRFHNRSNCSGLKRTILFVREDETKGVPCCSRCGG